ncbi:hypothetical protein [Salmonirosea aquatica]|uniref:Alpha/beta hydrolase n=1 Tax=Salmonirosea aquatica TaxID=2654236 RepID=A0A7C9BF42_9BACT|nr:hypothetical protein [Cytophagaceae bacterium SJW1-29]
MKLLFLLRLIFNAVFLLAVPWLTVSVAQPTGEHSATTDSGARLLRFEANPAMGFHFPYFVFVPAGTPLHDTRFLLVEPNNTGVVNDTLAVHERAAYYAARTSSVGNYVAKALRVPLLVPVFPRPFSDSLTYTHALDRDAVLIAQGPLKRLDLQLLAMIENARRQLDTLGIVIHQKVWLTGFSASGTFVNRLTMIHPDRIAATACGGINAMPILPLNTLRGRPLAYPLGLYDFKQCFGKDPDLKMYQQVPQFLYMGELDENDAALYDDAYSDEERGVIFSVIGKPMFPDRWATCEIAYRMGGATAWFKTYSGIGHGTDDKINTEVARFFQTAMNPPGIK